MQAAVTNQYIIRLTAPIALALLIPLVSNLTNNFFLGQLGEQALAVNGVASLFYLTLTMVGYGLSSGVQVQLSRRAAQHDLTAISRILVSSAVFTAFLSVSLVLLSLSLAPLIFGLSLHRSDHIELSVSFLFVRVWGLPFLLLTQLANSFYISTARSQYLLAGSLLTTALNLLLDYVLIFGRWGMPAMGLNGAAVASVLAELSGWAIMWGLFYFRRLNKSFCVADHLRINLTLIGQIVRIASPLVVQYFFSIAGWLVFFIFVEHLGQRELAASQILRPIFGLIGTTTWAFATTCNMMVSNVIGQGKSRRVPQLILKIIVLSVSVSLLLCAILLLSGRYYLHLFTDDESLVEMALPSLYIIVGATLVMSVASVLFNGVIGTGNTRVNLIIEVICVGCYLLYSYLVIERARLGLTWAWTAEFVYWTSLLVCGYFYLRSGRWRGKVI